MAYNMKRGNSAVPFKELGSSPAKHPTHGDHHGVSQEKLKKYEESDTQGRSPGHPDYGKKTKPSFGKKTKHPESSPAKQKVDLTKKEGLGPRAEKKGVDPFSKEEQIIENMTNVSRISEIPISPGFEDPIKIQKLQRKGLTPGSQTFIKKKKKK